MVISYHQAIEIAKKFAEELRNKFHDKITAVFAIGSLGSNYYRPGKSDIDTFIITNCTRNDKKAISKEIRTIANRYQNEFDIPKGFGAVVVAEGQLYPPYVAKEEIILEILRLKTQSKLIYGSYDIEKIPMPPKQAIIDNELAFQGWVDGERKKKTSQDKEKFNRIAFINSTLMLLKRYLLIQHEIIEFNKFKVIELYLANTPPFVNDEVFDFINSSLHDRDISLGEEHMSRMLKWRNELEKIINDLVLYNN